MLHQKLSSIRSVWRYYAAISSQKGNYRDWNQGYRRSGTGMEWGRGGRGVDQGGLGSTGPEKDSSEIHCVVKIIHDEKRVVSERQSGRVAMNSIRLSALSFCSSKVISHYCAWKRCIVYYFVLLSVCFCRFNCFESLGSWLVCRLLVFGNIDFWTPYWKVCCLACYSPIN